MVTQLAREAGAYVIATGRAADRQKSLDFGAQEYVDLDNDILEDAGGVDLVFDVIGDDIQTVSTVNSGLCASPPFRKERHSLRLCRRGS